MNANWFAQVLAIFSCQCSLSHQCDQMARIFVRYLATNNYKNLPNSVKIAKVDSKNFPTTKLTISKLPKAFKFCQSGQILPNLVTLLVFCVCHSCPTLIMSIRCRIDSSFVVCHNRSQCHKRILHLLANTLGQITPCKMVVCLLKKIFFLLFKWPSLQSITPKCVKCLIFA